MATKKPENVYREIGRSFGNMTKALSSLQDANIKIRKKEEPTLDDILKRDDVSDMDSDSFNKWFNKFISNKDNTGD